MTAVRLNGKRNTLEGRFSLGTKRVAKGICDTWTNAAVSAQLAHGWPGGAVAAAHRAAGGAVTVALQEVLGLCGVEQGIDGDQLTG